jgi:hypothetical protein
MILLVGDSNLRNTLEGSKERLEAAVGDEVQFKMATSTESIKTILEAVDQEPSVIFIHSPLNEIVKTVSKTPSKGRDETIRTVLEEQNRIVHASAVSKPTVLHVLIPPFLRLDPPWIGKKIRLATFYVKDYLTSESPWNIVVANSIDIVESDLGDDKVHLNANGKEKFYQSIEADILKCKANLGDGQPLSQDWASQMDTGFEPPTPATLTLRKRRRPVSEDESEDEEDTGRVKKAKLDTMLDKIDTLVKEIQQERSSTREEIGKIDQKVIQNTAEIASIKTSIEGLDKAIKSHDNYMAAETREDIDGLENENLKQTVVVRKLKAVDPVPSDKKALRAYIQTAGRKLVGKILDEDSVCMVKFAAPLYSYLDPTKKDNAAGLVPPFKIGFANKDIAVKFKEAGVKKSKEEGSEYKTTYFSYFQANGTRVRVILLWGVADALKSEGKDLWVTQNTPKPVLQIKEGGKITESLTFVKAMKLHKDKIEQKRLDEAKKLAKKWFAGNLEKIFIAIKD